MALQTPDSHAILLRVLEQHSEDSKWTNKPFGKIKLLSNTKVGAVGQQFIEMLCAEVGFRYELPETGRSPWDIKIEEVNFEIKTATEDTNGNFQFNHIRYHREYDAVLCIGATSDEVYVRAWSKSAIATGKAGRLVSMDKGSSATFKLTKKKKDMSPIGRFEKAVSQMIERANSQ